MAPQLRLATTLRRRLARAMRLRHRRTTSPQFVRLFLVATCPRVRLIARVCGCLNDSLLSYSSPPGKRNWHEL
eukprot:8805588-Lingulodinium_polyedra.AAC.1